MSQLSSRAALLAVAASLLGAPAAAHAAPAPTFGAAQTYGSFSQAYGVAYADITGDGIGDAIVADRGAAKVSVLPGAADGTFGAAVDTTVGAYPQAVAVGDFNGDGHKDVATADYSGTVSVALNDGSGGLAAANSFTANAATYDNIDHVNDLVAGDFNGDGRDDLAASGLANGSPVSGRLLVAFSSADGSFAADDVHTYYIGSNRSGSSVAAGDLNEDGKLDLITANYGRQDLTFFLNGGSGTFSDSSIPSLAAGSATAAVALADVDGDHHLDAVFSYSTADIGVFRGHGDGTFDATPVTQHEGTGQQLYDLVVGDLNGDALPDAVTADFGSRTFSVWPNAGGTFGAATGFAVGKAAEYVNYPSGVALADIDGDGKLDVLTTVAYSGSAGLTVRHNTTPFPATAITSPTVAEVTATSAKVAATVSSADSDGTWKFGYGTAPEPSAFTTAQPLTANSGSKDVDAVLTGLSPATTYHVRVLVTNAVGQTSGADVTFTTKAQPADQNGTPKDDGSGSGDTSGGGGGSQPPQQHPAGPAQPQQPQPPVTSSSAPPVTPIQIKSDQAGVIAATIKAFKAVDLTKLLAGAKVAPQFVAREPGTLTIAGDTPGGATPRVAGAARKRAPVRLLSGKKTFKAAGAAKVPIKLTAKGRALLRKSKKLTVVLTTTWKSQSGQTVVSHKKITLKAKKANKARGKHR